MCLEKLKLKIKKCKILSLKVCIIFFCFGLLIVFYSKYHDYLSLNSFNSLLDYFNVSKIECKKDKNFQCNGLRIFVLDVGHGDSILIEFGEEGFEPSFALIDTGSAKCCDKLINCLHKHKVKKLSFILISHLHEDHMGALGEVLKDKSIESVDQIVVPNYFKVKDKIINYHKIKKILKEKNILIKNVQPDQKISVGKASFEILHPIVEKKFKLPKDINNSSVVGILKYNKFKMMFTGDATKFLENKIINNFAPEVLRCDVLKLAHHGSDTSSSWSFLKVVDPKFVVVSSGQEKDVLYPHVKVRKKLENLNIDCYNTRVCGDIVIDVSENGKINLDFVHEYES